jgi:hypothetical protein
VVIFHKKQEEVNAAITYWRHDTKLEENIDMLGYTVRSRSLWAVT